MATAAAEGPKSNPIPLVRPGKAVALEAQIELWPAMITAVSAFQFLKTTPRCEIESQSCRINSCS